MLLMMGAKRIMVTFSIIILANRFSIIRYVQYDESVVHSLRHRYHSNQFVPPPVLLNGCMCGDSSDPSSFVLASSFFVRDR
mmetsp:Transcript_35215/g.35736  ORF Transcript_35215/g.35736 Transcript_35215/m.35736 type:complete len:81 (-) Transcript_35215:1155-1397(-)